MIFKKSVFKAEKSSVTKTPNLDSLNALDIPDKLVLIFWNIPITKLPNLDSFIIFMIFKKSVFKAEKSSVTKTPNLDSLNALDIPDKLVLIFWNRFFTI